MKIDYDKTHNLFQQGRLAMEKESFTKAIELFQCSAKLFPHFKTFELLGECWLNSNKPKDAIPALAAAVGLGTKPFRARYLLGKALMQIGQQSDAIDQLKEAIALKSDYKAAKDLLNKLQSNDK